LKRAKGKAGLAAWENSGQSSVGSLQSLEGVGNGLRLKTEPAEVLLFEIVFLG